MKFLIKNDLQKLIDDNVFIVLLFAAMICVLSASFFKEPVTYWITIVASSLVT
ncbi:hypothetical protein VHA01S_074_00040 [Vibrio halioticoli NBRC 102217]|uniref:Uncharacterized protein n=1 Tax=Vibrio halioticoli NBRC 102217 TaxID=1219072 RepID=V5FHK0_9VIBR|nr:hypothetical protein VHA01S_074_00040 [Vibrio halioticoli NBRC 102217]